VKILDLFYKFLTKTFLYFSYKNTGFILRIFNQTISEILHKNIRFISEILHKNIRFISEIFDQNIRSILEIFD
jgi:hypothetical protein